MKGTRLAGYEIIEKLGEGGMGEVWRARDEQLGRTVAIKLLPVDFSSDPDRRARFEQEARALAALNHPNVVSVYGAGDFEGRAYIVSELIEGEPLRAAIERGRLPFRKLIEVAVQIAEAMAAAHAAGIVHRDLKPENIMLTPEGRVKVLDFGLAKRTARSAPETTATQALSQPGVVLGTAGYMSPEQVRGEAVDSRSDIFSFGAVLYELITGKRAFSGNSSVETMHAILHQDPVEGGELEHSLPAALHTIVRRCLEKRPEQRFQSAADLAFALRAIEPTGISGAHHATAAQPTAKRTARAWVWPLAALAGALVLFGVGYQVRGFRSETNLLRYQRITFRTGLVTNARFIPGGRNVVYSAKWETGPARIYLANPGTPDSRDLLFPDESMLAAVSPKEEIAFVAPPFQTDGSGTLSRGSISGGQMRPALDGILDADWAPDGLSLAILRRVNGKTRLEYPIGTTLWSADGFPPIAMRISPDGKRFAIAHYYKGSSIAISMIDQLKQKPARATLLSVVSDQNPNRVDPILSWSADSREVLYRSFDPREWGTIYAMDLKGRRRLVAQVPGHITLYDVAPDGRMLLRTDNRQVGILGVAPGQTAEVDLSFLDASDLVGISADGGVTVSGVSGESGGPKGSVYLRKTDGSPCVRLGDGTAYSLSPDGKWVGSFTSADATTRRYALLPTGAGEEQVISVPGLKGVNLVFGWQPDKESLLVFGPGKTRNYQNFIWNQKTGALRTIGPEGQGDQIPGVSPDGRRILTTGPDGGWWVYPVDGGAGTPLHALSEHEYPVGWRSDNRSIFVVTHHDENRMIPVSVLDLESGVKTAWKEIRPARPVERAFNVNITPDGRAYAYNFIVKTSELYIATAEKGR